jgi:uncharacterized membrane protein (UPF0136 family)
MKLTGGIVLAYGVIVMLGGLIAYLMADSWVSLFTATLAGAVLVAGGMGIIRRSLYAYFISVGVTTVLAIFFIFRYIQTEKMMPAGIMTGMSVLILLLLLITRGRIPNKMQSK